MKFRSDHFIMIMNNRSREFRSRELRKERGLASKKYFYQSCRLHVTSVWPKNKKGAWDPLVPAPDLPMIRVRNNLDCKTVRIFVYSSTREQSNKRSGMRLKTESETGERR